MTAYPNIKINTTVSIFALLGMFSVTNSVQAQEDENRAVLEEVTISASRIKRSGFESSTPVTVIGDEMMRNTGVTNVADIINQLPAFTGSVTPTSTALNSQGQGANSLDLRGLGPNRTLILLNGRRHVPTNASGSVDINVVPSIAIKRVEVVTGGASAAWGSDAMAGVVNMIYDDNLEGLKLDAQYGISGKGDMDNYRLAAAFGSDVADGRGHILLAAEYNKSEGIGSPRNREWGKKQFALIGNEFIPNAGLYFAHSGGAIVSGFGQPPQLADIAFGPGGTVMDRELGQKFGLVWMVGGDSIDFAAEGTLVVPYERKNLFGAFEYEIFDNVNFFFDGSFAKTSSENGVVQSASFIFGNATGLPILSGNPYIPESIQTIMDDNGIGGFGLVRSNEDIGIISPFSGNETYRVAAGFNGEFGNGWSWEAYYQRGENSFLNIRKNNIVVSNFFDAIDVISDPDTGAPVCRVGGSCVPLNLFGAGSPSQAAIDYVSGDEFTRVALSQDVISASASGDVIDNWAGPVSVSFGLEYRKESSKTEVNKLSQENGYIIGNTQPLAGSYDAKEVFGEFVMPLLPENSGMGNSMELNGAIRLTDYSTSGKVTTWKAGLTYRPNDELLFRGVISRDIRAPNISEFFSSERLAFANVFNPLTGASDFTQSVDKGNVDLKPERAITKILGFVYSPAWVEGLQLSVDWYDINITDAITPVGPQAIVNNCLIEDIQVFCDAITIGAGNDIQRILDQLFNVATLHSSGLDIEMNYQTNLDNGANLGLHIYGNYTFKKEDSPDGTIMTNRAGEVRVDNGGIPKLKLNGNVSYSDGPWGVFAQVRYIGSAKYDVTLDSTQLLDKFNNIGAEVYTDISARYAFNVGDGEFEVYGGVNNVFDNDPALVPRDFVNNIQTNGGIYDVVGRFYYMGVRANF